MQKPQKKALLVQMGRQQELLKRYSHCLNFQIYHTSLFYPNFIKQLRLKGDICLALHQMLEVHPPHEYAILSVSEVVWGGLC